MRVFAGGALGFSQITSLMPRRQTINMVSKCITFLVAALTLANCCALGNGCAPECGAPIAWDGLGPAPTDDTQPGEPRPKKHARAKREIIVGPLDAAAAESNSKVQPKDSWEQQQAADQAEEVRLKRKLMICRPCLAGESARDAQPAASIADLFMEQRGVPQPRPTSP
jgi:hypothetical protein